MGSEMCLFCGSEVERTGRGRPRLFCSDACTSEAGYERARLRRLIGRLEEEFLAEAGRFVLPGRSVESQLLAARRRLVALSG